MPPEALSTTRPTPLRLWGFLLTAVGGTLAGVGALLDWAAVGFPGDPQGNLDVPVKGIDVWEGKVVLLAAVLGLVGTVAMRLTTAARARRSIAVGIIVMGALAAVLGLSVALRPEARLGGGDRLDGIAANLSEQLGEDEAAVRERLEQRFGDQLRVELAPGVWIAIAGAALVVAGGSLGLVWARQSVPDALPGEVDLP